MYSRRCIFRVSWVDRDSLFIVGRSKMKERGEDKYQANTCLCLYTGNCSTTAMKNETL